MKPKVLLGGALLLMAVAVIIGQGLASGAQYFLSIEQLRQKEAEFQNQSVRISGAIIGETIQYDAQALQLEFAVVDTIDQIGAQEPLRIKYEGPRPELLQDQAQAIMEGRLNADGTFYADSLLLKCPTRYEEEFPEQSLGN
ncbi:MAG TPA: cytochrome c maturation protein CcmE [Anaerolineae bacterium]|nr:cytochrome c maturation protein CcmE [Anaerolineae bacterium]